MKNKTAVNKNKHENKYLVDLRDRDNVLRDSEFFVRVPAPEGATSFVLYIFFFVISLSFFSLVSGIEACDRSFARPSRKRDIVFRPRGALFSLSRVFFVFYQLSTAQHQFFFSSDIKVHF